MKMVRIKISNILGLPYEKLERWNGEKQHFKYFDLRTCEKLLMFLYDFRFYNRIPVIITSDALVSLATYKPTTKEEFVSLRGLGPKVYDKCGEIFLKATFFKKRS